MENPVTKKLPLYAKFSLIIMGTVAFFFILYVGREIILPFIYATLIAILLNPIVNFLHKRKINRVLAIAIAMIIGTLLIGGIVAFISWQLTIFADTWPMFREKFYILFNDVNTWVRHTFNVTNREVNGYLENMKSEGLNSTPDMLGTTLSTLFDIVIIGFLLPVYIFMILFYKPLLLDFFAMVFPKNHHATVADVLVQSSGLIQSYLTGLLIEAAIVAVLNSVGLFILGIKYAILLGIIGALLNIIPYIGGMIAIALSMLVAFATKSPVSALLVAGMYLLVQVIDNNIIMPKVVGSKVKINGLASIIVVFIGGALWGVSGMFLSIPITAMVKVVCDHVEPLKPLGFLLGDTMQPLTKIKFNYNRNKKTNTSTNV